MEGAARLGSLVALTGLLLCLATSCGRAVTKAVTVAVVAVGTEVDDPLAACAQKTAIARLDLHGRDRPMEGLDSRRGDDRYCRRRVRAAVLREAQDVGKRVVDLSLSLPPRRSR